VTKSSPYHTGALGNIGLEMITEDWDLVIVAETAEKTAEKVIEFMEFCANSFAGPGEWEWIYTRAATTLEYPMSGYIRFGDGETITAKQLRRGA
jgi:hypothetical protein